MRCNRGNPISRGERIRMTDAQVYHPSDFYTLLPSFSPSLSTITPSSNLFCDCEPLYGQSASLDERRRAFAC